MSGDDLTPEQRRRNQALRSAGWSQESRRQALAGIREGADALHARAAYTKPKTLTDAESTAIARAKLEGRNNQ